MKLLVLGLVVCYLYEGLKDVINECSMGKQICKCSWC